MPIIVADLDAFINEPPGSRRRGGNPSECSRDPTGSAPVVPSSDPSAAAEAVSFSPSAPDDGAGRPDSLYTAMKKFRDAERSSRDASGRVSTTDCPGTKRMRVVGRPVKPSPPTLDSLVRDDSPHQPSSPEVMTSPNGRLGDRPADPTPTRHRPGRWTASSKWCHIALILVTFLLTWTYALLAVFIVAPWSMKHSNITIDAATVLAPLELYSNLPFAEAVHKVWTNTSVIAETVCAMDNLQCNLLPAGAVSVTAPWYRDRASRQTASPAFPVACPVIPCTGNGTPRSPPLHRQCISDLLSVQTTKLLVIHDFMLGTGKIAYDSAREWTDIATRIIARAQDGGLYGIRHSRALYDAPDYCDNAAFLRCRAWRPGWIAFRSMLFLRPNHMDDLEADNVRRIERSQRRLLDLPRIRHAIRNCTETQFELIRALHLYGFPDVASRLNPALDVACRLPSQLLVADGQGEKGSVESNSECKLSEVLRKTVRRQDVRRQMPFGLSPLLGVPGTVIDETGRALTKEGTAAVVAEGLQHLVRGSPAVMRSMEAWEFEQMGWETDMGRDDMSYS